MCNLRQKDVCRTKDIPKSLRYRQNTMFKASGVLRDDAIQAMASFLGAEGAPAGTIPDMLRRAPSTCRRPLEVTPMCRCPCLLPAHRRLPNAAKRPIYPAAPTRSGSHCRRSCLVPIPIGPPPQSGEAPALAGGAHVRRRVSTAASA